MLTHTGYQLENLNNDYSGASSDSHLLELWLQGKAISTQKIYQRHASQFLVAVGKPLTSVTLKDVYAYADTLSHLAASTIKSRLYTVKSLMSFAHKLGYTSFNVAAVVKPPKVAIGVHSKALKPAQITNMIAHTISNRDALLIRLGFTSGMRAAELASLTWSCLHDDVLTIIGKGSKERSIKLPDWLVNELTQVKPVDCKADSPIFRSRKGGHLTTRQITRIVKDAAIKAGESSDVSAHWLRHSHVTEAILRGDDYKMVATTTGHSDPGYLIKVYVANNPSDSSAMRQERV
jgi:integrase/recombinase XerD